MVPCDPLRIRPAAATVVGVSAVSSAALQVAHDDGGLHGVLAITALIVLSEPRPPALHAPSVPWFSGRHTLQSGRV